MLLDNGSAEVSATHSVESVTGSTCSSRRGSWERFGFHSDGIAYLHKKWYVLLFNLIFDISSVRSHILLHVLLKSD